MEKYNKIFLKKLLKIHKHTHSNLLIRVSFIHFLIENPLCAKNYKWYYTSLLAHCLPLTKDLKRDCYRLNVSSPATYSGHLLWIEHWTPPNLSSISLVSLSLTMNCVCLVQEYNKSLDEKDPVLLISVLIQLFMVLN